METAGNNEPTAFRQVGTVRWRLNRETGERSPRFYGLLKWDDGGQSGVFTRTELERQGYKFAVEGGWVTMVIGPDNKQLSVLPRIVDYTRVTYTPAELSQQRDRNVANGRGYRTDEEVAR